MLAVLIPYLAFSLPGHYMVDDIVEVSTDWLVSVVPCFKVLCDEMTGTKACCLHKAYCQCLLSQAHCSCCSVSSSSLLSKDVKRTYVL